MPQNPLLYPPAYEARNKPNVSVSNDGTRILISNALILTPDKSLLQSACTYVTYIYIFSFL